MNHDLAEKTAGLASRINNLAVNHVGKTCRQLLELQDRLAKLTLVAIVKELNAEHDAYKEALSGLNEAVDFIGNADKKIKAINKTIKLTAQAVDLVEKALKNAIV